MEDLNYHAWAAGFVDGEGCIYLKPFKNKRSAGGIRHQPYLVVGQTREEPLQRLCTLYGGNIRLRRAGGQFVDAKRKPLWAWELGGGKGVGAALTAMRPWLTVKAAEADVLLEFISTLRPAGVVGPPLTAEELGYRQQAVAKLQELKAA